MRIIKRSKETLFMLQNLAARPLESKWLLRCTFVFKKHWVNLRRRGTVYHPRRFFVFAPLRLVYLSVPKAACTSIKAALAKACGIAIAHELEIHDIHSRPEMRVQTGKLNEAQNGYYKFSFVRNPFDRLVSCYRDKIIFAPSPQPPTQPYYASYFFSLPTNISFSDFAERISKIPDRLADIHFKSQHALLYSEGRLQVDYLGRFENLDHDWKPLSEKYQLDSRLSRSNVSKHNSGGHSDYRLYYTEALAKLVYERYRADVEIFGYEQDYQLLLEFIRRREP